MAVSQVRYGSQSGEIWQSVRCDMAVSQVRYGSQSGEICQSVR